MKRLTRNYIEGMANSILKDYYALPEFMGKEIYRVEPDILLQRVLNLNIEYAHLSSDESVLGLTSFDEMTDISKSLREKLKENTYIDVLEIITVQKSKDGTHKFLIKLHT